MQPHGQPTAPQNPQRTTGLPEVVSRRSAGEIKSAVDQLAAGIAKNYGDDEHLAIVGIANGGIELSKRLAASLEKRLAREVPHGIIDISFHRDDIGIRPITHITMPTELWFDVDDRTIVLVDDVLFSGRTVRAAINEIFDQGRPEAIELCALFDRGHRKLPIQARFVGIAEPVAEGFKVQVLLDNEAPERDEIKIIRTQPEPTENPSP
jgi:pyrimidine operon attenuation protein/uracil phosphoribosyltransferase